MSRHPSHRLLGCLPRAFDFYHLGSLELIETAGPEGAAPVPATAASTGLFSDDRVALGYTLQGDARGALVLLLDRSLDVSTYSEAGNIIASRMATALATQTDASEDKSWVEVSPPRVLSRAQRDRILSGGQAAACTYVHRHGQWMARITALVLAAPDPFDAPFETDEVAVPNTEKTGHA